MSVVSECSLWSLVQCSSNYWTLWVPQWVCEIQTWMKSISRWHVLLTFWLHPYRVPCARFLCGMNSRTFFFSFCSQFNAHFIARPDKNRNIHKSELYKQLHAMPMIVRQGNFQILRLCFEDRHMNRRASETDSANMGERKRSKDDDDYDDDYMRCALEITCWKRWIGTYHT